MSCGGDLENCGGVCRDLENDRLNCGACGTPCASGEVCIDGGCELMCPGAQLACGSSCRDTQTDFFHCGGCDTTCGDGQQCISGSCQLVCPPGLTMCNGECIDTNTNHQACGNCTTSCSPGQVCDNGMCTTSCGTGLVNCGGSCVDLTSSNAHCGACGSSCANYRACVSGSCTPLLAPDVVRGTPIDSPVQFGGGGGSDFTRTCPVAHVLVGYGVRVVENRDWGCGFLGAIACCGSSSRRIGEIQPICAPISVRWTGTDYAVRTGVPQVNLGHEGSNTCHMDGIHYDMCPENQVVIGMTGRFGSNVDQLRLQCASVTATGGPGAWSTSVGSVSHTTPVRGHTSNGSAFTFPCPAGRVGARFAGRSGDRIDRIRLDCATVTFVDP